MQPPPNPSAVAGAAGGALGRRKLRTPLVAGGVEGAMSSAGGNAPSAPPDASRVAAKLPGLKGFRLATGMPQPKVTPSAPMFADKVGRMAPPVGSEAAIQDFAAQNPGISEDFIRNAAGGPPAAPPEVQGRALNPDGTSITGRGGNRQELGANALRKLRGMSAAGTPLAAEMRSEPDFKGANDYLDRVARGDTPGVGGPGGSDADMVSKRLPPGLKGFRLPPGFNPPRLGGAPLPDGPREPDFLMNPPPTDEVMREIDAAGPKPMIAEEPPMEQGPLRRRPPGGRMLGPTLGGRSQDY